MSTATAAASSSTSPSRGARPQQPPLRVPVVIPFDSVYSSSSSSSPSPPVQLDNTNSNHQRSRSYSQQPQPHRNYSTRTNDSSSRLSPHTRGHSPNTPTSPTGLNFPSVHLGSFDSFASNPLHSQPDDDDNSTAVVSQSRRDSPSTAAAHRRYASKDSVRSVRSSGGAGGLGSKSNLTAPPFASSGGGGVAGGGVSGGGGPSASAGAQQRVTSSSSTSPSPIDDDAPLRRDATAPSAVDRPPTVDRLTESPTDLDLDPEYKGADVTVTPSSPDQTHAPTDRATAAQTGVASASSPSLSSSPSQATSPPAPSSKRHTKREPGSPPLLSPLSLDGPSLARFGSTSLFKFDDAEEGDNDGENSITPQPPSSSAAAAARPVSWAPGATGGASGTISQFGVVPDARAPSPLLTPTSSTFDLASPRLRESPSVPRRRTIIQASHVAKRASGIHPARESVPPPARALEEQQTTPVAAPAAASIEGETPSSPSPNPRRITSVSSLGASSTTGARPRLHLSFPEPVVASEAGTSTAVDSRSPQDLSPTKKRTLPRPPKSSKDTHNPTSPTQPLSSETISMPTPMPVAVAAPPAITSPSFTIQATSPKANMTALGIVAGEPMPSMRSPPPPPGAARSPPPQQQQRPARASTDPRASIVTSVDAQPQQPDKSKSVPTPIPVRHRPTKSASNFPNIPGLSDAGPYPTQMRSPNGLGLPALPALPGAGAVVANGMQLPAGIKPGEEICLECMMRDRDLADVDVTGNGVWDRDSDIALEDLKAREYDVLRGMSIDHSISTLSMEDSISSSTHAETASSPRSHASGLPSSDDASRAAALKKQQAREARRVRRDERDAQVARIGWRGFKWEEGSGGDGFPRGFRGTRPGALTEKGIKNVLTMYPSSSALRYQILQSYLRNQYRLIIEIRQEAQRHGHYAEPEELMYPPSPTLSSHDSQPSSAGGARGAPSIKAPSISTARSAPVTMQLPTAPRLRESPSTPAGLNSGVQARPRTQYLGEHDPQSRLSTATNIRQTLHVSTTSPPNRQSHFKNPSTSVGTKGRESKFFAGDEWSDTEDLWPGYDDLGSPTSGNLRPFSFAVRAGQQREGSVGSHHRRSFFGKFGDSVTSFFTGSQGGGSGSMMDMHLGIDMDRRNRTSSYQAHESPRVSAYVPARPAFSTRQSSYTAHPQMDDMPASAQDRPRARSVAVPQAHQVPHPRQQQGPPRPTPVSMYAADDEVSPKKKNGIKGLLQKMKGKKGRGSFVSATKAEEMGLGQAPPAADLEPPPPMNFLVNRNERNHDRKRSSSSFSMANDSQPSLPPGSPAHTSQRSVSAPLGSSGSDVSPTSSRFLAERPSDIPRRSTAPVELPPGAAESGFHMRKSSQPSPGMEMLSGTPPGGVPQMIAGDSAAVYSDEPQLMGVRDSVVGPPGATAPNSYYRQSQPSLSSRLSGSSTTVPAIETPEPMNGSMYLAPGSQGNTSPNRYKNLPPLPPGMVQAMPSPDQFSDADSMRQMSMYENGASRMSTASSFPRTSVMCDGPTVHRAGVPPSAEYFPTASPRYHQAQLGSPPHMTVPMPNMPASSTASSPGGMPTPFLQPNNGGFVPQHRVIQPRASFDALADHRNQRVRRSTAVPGMHGMPADMGRNAQSMYINQAAAASTGSFGRFLKGGAADGGHLPPPYVTNVVNSVPVTEDKKERRRGIKSIFGKK